MKLKEVFEKSVQFFKEKKIESARLDAEILLSHALKIERLQIYLKYEQPLSENEIQACREVVKRRSQGEPVAYITKEKGFFGFVFSVGAGVLIPRPETELIVEEALEFIKAHDIEAPKILDLGAGTGCIGFSILKNCFPAKLVSVERSAEAFEYLKMNQTKLELADRSELILADVLQLDSLKDTFDIIVANPPYIAKEDLNIESNVKKFEPSSALFSETNGFSDIAGWSKKYSPYLSSTGLILFEIGHLQGPAAKSHFEGLVLKDGSKFTSVQILKDLAGLDRVVKAVHNNQN